jgi:hypothetical protein
MQRRAATIAVCLMIFPYARVDAQHSSGSSLMVRVNPEARVEPARIALSFHISADGGSDITIQGATVAAWVRALPGRRIQLKAHLATLDGPGGPVAPSAVIWKGAATQSSAGGRQAACTNGRFVSADAQDLVQGWSQSGSLRCSVSFQLAEPGALAPGSYTGMVELGAGSS